MIPDINAIVRVVQIHSSSDEVGEQVVGQNGFNFKGEPFRLFLNAANCQRRLSTRCIFLNLVCGSLM